MIRSSGIVMAAAATLGMAVAAPSFAQGDAQAQVNRAQETLRQIDMLIDTINARNGSGGAAASAPTPQVNRVTPPEGAGRQRANGNNNNRNRRRRPAPAKP